MSVRSAEAANKQHQEGVKKVAKLEAECRRLRGLVRKKLPGPTTLAQMKLEVESLGRDYGDSCVKKSQGGRPSLPDFSLDSVQKFHKENEQLTERLLAMEEETKMLKEALAHRNSELQTSRSICAKTASKLQNLEAQLQANAEQKSRQKSTMRRQHFEGSLRMKQITFQDWLPCPRMEMTIILIGLGEGGISHIGLKLGLEKLYGLNWAMGCGPCGSALDFK
ncbi:Filament-like plant protein 4 [Capsicum chinense]|nr:Filament-like plant protein 4 [Capsicum chinense]